MSKEKNMLRVDKAIITGVTASTPEKLDDKITDHSKSRSHNTCLEILEI